jgi:hypothetical protein
MFVVKMDIEAVIGTMYHVFQSLPHLSIMSMRLCSSIQCSSTQKMHRHSHDPIMYMAERKFKPCYVGHLFFDPSIRWPCKEHH